MRADPPKIHIYTTTITHIQPCPPCPDRRIALLSLIRIVRYVLHGVGSDFDSMELYSSRHSESERPGFAAAEEAVDGAEPRGLLLRPGLIDFSGGAGFFHDDSPPETVRL